ncbi:glycosyltransferase [Actinomycetaceae bacterium TAE3-ERU4]|nr:glycosyltransferase [Actinomycetaceae bacterium TAE3-ERU4]
MRPLLIATRIFYPENGAAAFRLTAVAKQAAKYRPVRVLTGALSSAETTPNFDDSKVVVKRAPVLRDKEGYVRGMLPFASFDIPLFFRILFAPRFSAIVSEPPPTTGTVVRLAAAIRRRPYIYYSADVATDAVANMLPRPAARLVEALERFCLRGAAAVIAVNEQVGQRVSELGARNVHVVQNGINTEQFSNSGAPLSDNEKKKMGIVGPYFIYTGTASQWQGAKIFAEALLEEPRLSDHQILFLSQGSEQDEINALALKSGGRIVTSDLLPAQEAARWISEASGALVSIVPGQGYDYAYPTKLYAAWSCATPTVYAGVGPAAADIAEHSLGIVCQYEKSAIAKAMAELLEANLERANLRSWVEQNRSLKKAGKRVSQIVEEVIGRYSRK